MTWKDWQIYGGVGPYISIPILKSFPEHQWLNELDLEIHESSWNSFLVNLNQSWIPLSMGWYCHCYVARFGHKIMLLKVLSWVLELARWTIAAAIIKELKSVEPINHAKWTCPYHIKRKGQKSVHFYFSMEVFFLNISLALHINCEEICKFWGV